VFLTKEVVKVPQAWCQIRVVERFLFCSNEICAKKQRANIYSGAQDLVS
jgi:hypothetical protein